MKDNLNLNRSFLFVPGDRPERFEKVCSSGSDVVIIDLEDAVSQSKKEVAREEVIKFFSNKENNEFKCFVRVNSIKTYYGLKDLIAFVDNNCFPDGFVLPMVDTAEEVTLFENIISDYKPDIELFIVIETPKGLSNVDIILNSSNKIKMVGFGSADFTSRTGSSLSWDSLLYARSKIVNSAGISGVYAIDGVWPDIKDEKGLIEETIKIFDMGFKGKMAIHPSQISGIHEAFVPKKEEVQFAREVIDAYEAAKGGVISVRGKMIDEPLVISARRIMSIAEKN